MTHHSMRLAAVLDAAGAAKVTEALRAIAGVGSISAEPGSDRIAVIYDTGRTSVMEMAAAVTRAGHSVKAPQHGGGSCCGGCGG